MSLVEICKAGTILYFAMALLTFVSALCRTRQLRPSFFLGLFWPFILLEND